MVLIYIFWRALSSPLGVKGAQQPHKCLPLKWIFVPFGQYCIYFLKFEGNFIFPTPTPALRKTETTPMNLSANGGFQNPLIHHFFFLLLIDFRNFSSKIFADGILWFSQSVQRANIFKFSFSFFHLFPSCSIIFSDIL